MNARQQQLVIWLEQQYPGQVLTVQPISGDASFRRYFRVTVAAQILVAMDAPPAQEDCRPFLHAAQVLHQAGVHVPQVLAHDLEQGFLLLTDLGNTLYVDALNEKSAAGLYREACDALVLIQQASRPGIFPDYDHALLMREMQLFPDWYVAQHVHLDLNNTQRHVLGGIFELLCRNVLAQGQVYVHRDYHSRNLMVCDPNPGILDFQDAVYGAISYDLVSLLKDAYVSWEEEQVLDWVVRYWEKARAAGLPVPSDISEFYRDFEWMGVQRHLKVLGIFARLNYRDHKSGYLKDMPLVMQYVRKACERYRDLHPLLRLLDDIEQVQPQFGYTF